MPRWPQTFIIMRRIYKLGRDVFEPYLKGLRDVAFDDEIKASVEDSEAYRVSLLRFSGAERTINDATRLLRAPTMPTKRRGTGFRFKFKTQVARGANAFIINFDFRRRGRLPNRINALIGYNGTGKTRLLSNLAIVASGYGYGSKKDLLDKAAGRFVDTAPPFKTVVVVSYSAFDTFVIPGRTQKEKERLQESGEIFRIRLLLVFARDQMMTRRTVSKPTGCALRQRSRQSSYRRWSASAKPTV